MNALALAEFEAALRRNPDFTPALVARCALRGDAAGCGTPAPMQAEHLAALNRRADAACRAGDDPGAIRDIHAAFVLDNDVDHKAAAFEP